MDSNSFNNTVNFTPEQSGDIQNVSYEQAPVVPETRPENIPIQSPEQAMGVERAAANYASQTVATTDDTAIDDQSAGDDIAADDQIQVASQIPATAEDSDIVEKEWVDKVKQIISKTSDDPYVQQSEASQLMAQYVLKRFGKKVGEPEEK